MNVLEGFFMSKQTELLWQSSQSWLIAVIWVIYMHLLDE